MSKEIYYIRVSTDELNEEEYTIKELEGLISNIADNEKPPVEKENNNE